jgi:hypothetical protein
MIMRGIVSYFTIILPIVLCSLNPFPGFSQDQDQMQMEKKSENPPQFNLGADLVSRYIWRGKDYGNSPAIQPNLSFSVAGFKIGAWGSYGFVPSTEKINDSTIVNKGNYAEMDLYMSYTLKNVTLMVYDYFLPNPLSSNSNTNYYNFKSATTGHTAEVCLSYAGPAKFPLQISIGTLVWGADKGKDSTGTYGQGTKNNYSTYMEAAYQFTVKDFGVKPFIGGIPFGSGWYGNSAGIVNAGVTVSKTIQFSKEYGLPVYTSLITNPQTQCVFFVFGLTF